jgi:hypothetical protein
MEEEKVEILLKVVPGDLVQAVQEGLKDLVERVIPRQDQLLLLLLKDLQEADRTTILTAMRVEAVQRKAVTLMAQAEGMVVMEEQLTLLDLLLHMLAVEQGEHV